MSILHLHFFIVLLRILNIAIEPSTFHHSVFYSMVQFNKYFYYYCNTTPPQSQAVTISKKKSTTTTDPTLDTELPAGWLSPKTTMNSSYFDTRTIYLGKTILPPLPTPTATPGSPGPKDLTPTASSEIA